MAWLSRVDPVRAWIGTVVSIFVILLAGLLTIPRVVYDQFLWQYFWGPVVADAQSAVCAVRIDGTTSLLFSSAECGTSSGIVAYPGYTLVSEIGYGLTLLLALFGVVFLLRRLNLGQKRNFFYALLPYMFLGGALRVVEDANDAVPAGVDPLIAYPINTLIISPVIYFTVFFFTLFALLFGVWLARTGVITKYEYPLLVIGVIGLTFVIGYLLSLAQTTDHVGFYPIISFIVLTVTTFLTAIIWFGINRFSPTLTYGTNGMGLVVVWAHTLDGVANVVGIDWGAELGLPYGDLVPKHPVNRALIEFGQQFPETITSVIGTAWPFLLLKIIAALFILYIFDEEVLDESPRFTILLLIAIVAVGLGPGTRDMLRATFGI